MYAFHSSKFSPYINTVGSNKKKHCSLSIELILNKSLFKLIVIYIYNNQISTSNFTQVVELYIIITNNRKSKQQ